MNAELTLDFRLALEGSLAFGGAPGYIAHFRCVGCRMDILPIAKLMTTEVGLGTFEEKHL